MKTHIHTQHARDSVCEDDTYSMRKVHSCLAVYKALIDLELMPNGWSGFFRKFGRWKLKSCAVECSAVRWMAARLRRVSNTNTAVSSTSLSKEHSPERIC